MSKYNVGLKPLQGLSEPEFYGVLVYTFRKIIALVKMVFLLILKKIIIKRFGYNIDVLRQTAYLVINPIKINKVAELFDCRG